MDMLTGLPLKFCSAAEMKRCSLSLHHCVCVCSQRFQYSGSILNTGKDCFQRRAKQCTLSCSQTDRCVWQTWFSEVLPSVPARGRHLYYKISLFFSVSRDANTYPDLLFFSYLSLFSPLLVFFCWPNVFVSFFQGFSAKKWIYSAFISLSCFFFHIPLLHVFLLTLFLCYTFLHNATSLWPPPYHPLPPNSLSSSLSHPPSPPSLLLTKVLQRGNKKCMYSVVVQCGSRRGNCCFMVLFMVL